MRNHYSVDDLRAFCTAARVGQFSEAAELLFITPSALSRRIANIELAVGGRVFDRSTRRLRLTAVGALLHERLPPLLAQLDGSFAEAARKAKGEEGVLVVAVVATVACSVVPGVLEPFKSRHPSVYLSIRDGFAGSIANMVEQRQAEFGIATHMAFSASLDARSLGFYGYNLVCSAADRTVGKLQQVRWDEVGAMRVVGLNALSSTRLQVDGELAARGIAPPWKLEADQLSTLLELVRSQGYVTVLPSVFNPGGGEFRRVPVVDPEIRRELFLVQRRDAALSAQATTLARLLAEKLQTVGTAA